MSTDFVIDQVSWHTRVVDNPETPTAVKRRFAVLAGFLIANGLAVRDLLPLDGKIGDDFAIRASDLTEEGLVVMKKAYDRWLTSLDEGASLEDVRILEKALRKLRRS